MTKHQLQEGEKTTHPNHRERKTTIPLGWGHPPEFSACKFFMGKRLLRPKMLLVKTVEELLTTATQAMVRAKKAVVQADVSTFTSTVITRKTASMTKREDRMRTLAGTLGTRGTRGSCL